MRTIFIGIIITLVIVAVVYGLYLTGTPGFQRQVRFDERRISDLQQISRAVSSYHTQAGQLPESLETLEPLDLFVPSLSDPKTGEPYEYRVVNEVAYELCAVFEADSALAPKPRFPSFDNWEYQEGRQCFEREVLVRTQE